MLLDPLVKGFLDQAMATPRPKPWETPIAVLRKNFAGFMGLVGPKDVPVGKTKNFTIPGPAGEIRARAYAPVAAGGDALPALIYFHGGGFVVGDLDTHDGLCRLFAHEGGFRVIAVEYRLAPEHKWPAPLEDATAALRWIAENAPALGVDAGRIAVGGDSAGGLLSACLTQAMRAKGGVAIAFQLLMFPSTDLAGTFASMEKFAVGYFMDKRTIEWNTEQVIPKGADLQSPNISPLRAKDFSGLPPAYVMLGGYDPLHDEGLAYAEKLKQAGVKVTVADYGDLVHCFIYLQTVLPQAHEAVSAAAKAVKDALAEA
ncbi:MAG TPA: alpha/beta hydrolase [Rhizomicrobium sp.]|nr:alpha/beta hydrolase [Rhizomicrobium sp.]